MNENEPATESVADVKMMGPEHVSKARASAGPT